MSIGGRVTVSPEVAGRDKSNTSQINLIHLTRDRF